VISLRSNRREQKKNTRHKKPPPLLAMADNQVSTPQSSNEPDNTSKVPKDRSCPFCGQAFTSSSLGRHLDLYIRPKNPKPPDGVHDVDEIRRIRGNITRRQSRVASVKRDPSTPAAAPAATNNGPEDGTPAKVISSPTGGIGERYESLLGVRLNKPGWESTGVINDLPPRPQQKPEPRKESSKHAHLKVELEQRRGIAEELDNGRAAELALQEVLQSVRDAKYVGLQISPNSNAHIVIVLSNQVAVCLNSIFLDATFPASVSDYSRRRPPYIRQRLSQHLNLGLFIRHGNSSTRH
jgi:hypothetical protein